MPSLFATPGQGLVGLGGGVVLACRQCTQEGLNALKQCTGPISIAGAGCEDGYLRQACRGAEGFVRRPMRMVKALAQIQREKSGEDMPDHDQGMCKFSSFQSKSETDLL